MQIIKRFYSIEDAKNYNRDNRYGISLSYGRKQLMIKRDKVNCVIPYKEEKVGKGTISIYDNVSDEPKMILLSSFNKVSFDKINLSLFYNDEKYSVCDYIGVLEDNAYIDTECSLNGNTSIYIDALNPLLSGNYAYFGASNGVNYIQGEFALFYYNDRFQFVLPSSNTSSDVVLNYSISTNTHYYINIDINNIDINNQHHGISNTYDDYLGTKSCYIFATNRSPSIWYAKYINIYEFIIKENGAYKRWMIPCTRNRDGMIGMFDVINNVFYTNKGTGTFIFQ